MFRPRSHPSPGLCYSVSILHLQLTSTASFDKKFKIDKSCFLFWAPLPAIRSYSVQPPCFSSLFPFCPSYQLYLSKNLPITGYPLLSGAQVHPCVSLYAHILPFSIIHCSANILGITPLFKYF